jgi:thiamine-monophosphate kinase
MIIAHVIIHSMKLSEIGEFGLIDKINALIESRAEKSSPAWKNLIVGIGDDAACWKNSSAYTLATTDCLVDGVHFKTGQSSWSNLGWKALAVNMSDIAAMGGTPEYTLVTLGLPEDVLVEDVLQMYEGMLEISNRFGVAIAGGDITASQTLFISIAVNGSSDGKPLLRAGVKPGDLIALTGYTGLAAAGRKLLESNKAELDSPSVHAFLKPSPRLAEGKLILESGGHACIDISDGLAADLGHICQASKVGAVIHVDKIPIHPELKSEFPGQALDLALGGGEDYELLFTAPAEVIARIKVKSQTLVSIIGEIVAGNSGHVRILDRAGEEYHLKNPGWNHFRHG